jgi:Mn-dependent DtxR family transcriptional regulator
VGRSPARQVKCRARYTSSGRRRGEALFGSERSTLRLGEAVGLTWGDVEAAGLRRHASAEVAEERLWALIGR